MVWSLLKFRLACVVLMIAGLLAGGAQGGLATIAGHQSTCGIACPAAGADNDVPRRCCCCNGMGDASRCCCRHEAPTPATPALPESSPRENLFSALFSGLGAIGELATGLEELAVAAMPMIRPSVLAGGLCRVLCRWLV